DRRFDLLLDGGEGTFDDFEDHRVHRATTRLPCPSTVAPKPGCNGRVDPYSSITAGPATTVPAPRSARANTSAGTHPDSNQTGRVPVGRGSARGGHGRTAGRATGPTPATRRFTHST